MRAAVLDEVGGVPTVQHFREPERDVVQVSLAGCNPGDLALACGETAGCSLPRVVGQEGVGYTIDGTRVYFNSPVTPFGSWGEFSRFDPDRTFPVPAVVDDDMAVALGIAGMSAWLPLTHHADLSAGQSVLILGAAGVVGSIAVQAAKILGARHIVAADTHRDSLSRTRDLGADAVVEIGGGDDVAALRDALTAETRHGYDVVVDMVSGEPFLAALEASAVGATLVTVDRDAVAAVAPFAGSTGRIHLGHNNNALPLRVLRRAYRELTGLAAEKRLQVDTVRYGFGEIERAWQAQAERPQVKIGITPR